MTTSKTEFWENEKPNSEYFYTMNEFWNEMKSSNGLCGHKTIWLRTLSPITLLHELIHYFITQIHIKAMKFRTPSLCFFLDFLTELYDFVNGIIRYKSWRENIHDALSCVKENWKDLWDWVLCR